MVWDWRKGREQIKQILMIHETYFWSIHVVRFSHSGCIFQNTLNCFQILSRTCLCTPMVLFPPPPPHTFYSPCKQIQTTKVCDLSLVISYGPSCWLKQKNLILQHFPACPWRHFCHFSFKPVKYLSWTFITFVSYSVSSK